MSIAANSEPWKVGVRQLVLQSAWSHSSVDDVATDGQAERRCVKKMAGDNYTQSL